MGLGYQDSPFLVLGTDSSAAARSSPGRDQRERCSFILDGEDRCGKWNEERRGGHSSNMFRPGLFKICRSPNPESQHEDAISSCRWLQRLLQLPKTDGPIVTSGDSTTWISASSYARYTLVMAVKQGDRAVATEVPDSHIRTIAPQVLNDHSHEMRQHRRVSQTP